MATYKARIKTVPTGSAFEVTTESGSLSTARQQIEKLYDPIYIQNLREVRGEGNSSGMDLGDISGTIGLIAVLFVIWLFMEYFWIMMPLTVIGLTAWIWKWFSE